VATRSGVESEPTTGIVPKRHAARTTPSVPSAWKSFRFPTGASRYGIRSALPSNVDDVSICETSRSTRGRKASASIDSRLRSIVVSVSAPPAM
jgi:hypothetical protein